MSDDLFKKVSKQSISAYQERLANVLKLSPATVNRRISTLRKFCAWAEKEGYLKENPFTLPKKEIERIRVKVPRYLDKLRPSIPSLPYLADAYRVYHSISITNYLHYAVLIIFCAALGFGFYQQFFARAPEPLAFPAEEIRPKRYLSFQGRLTDSSDNPISSQTNFVFKLYDAASGGNTLWDSGTCQVTPDQDGIFAVILGTTSGSGYTCSSASEIASSVFSENAEVWLGVKVASDNEATPRIQVATVAYALNTETLQGFPLASATSGTPEATMGATVRTVPALNPAGNLVIAATSPTLWSTSGTFAIKGQALSIVTDTGTGGNIAIDPDGTGKLNITLGGATGNQMRVTDANITGDALVSVYAGTNATGFDLLNLSSGSTETTVFSVDESGNTYAAGSVGIGTTNPGVSLDVVGGSIRTNADMYTGDLYLGYDDTSATITTSDNENLTIDPNSTGDIFFHGSTYYIDDSSLAYLSGLATTGYTPTAGEIRADVFRDGNSNYYIQPADTTIAGVFAGKVGIGTTSPSQKLDVAGNATVSGTLALGPQTQAYAGTCNASSEGKMYYDAGESKYYYCDGGSWTQMGAGGGGLWTDEGTYIYPSTTTGGYFRVYDDSSVAQSSTVGTSGTAYNLVANSLTTGKVLSLSSTSITSGDVLYLANNTANNAYLIRAQAGSTLSNRLTLDSNGLLKVFDSSGSNSLNLSHNGTNALITASSGNVEIGSGGGDFLIGEAGTAVDIHFAESGNIEADVGKVITMTDIGNITPDANDQYDLGSDTLRWANFYLGPGTLHIGTLTSDEATLTYNTATNDLIIESDGDVILQDGGGSVGIGTTSPVSIFSVGASSQFQVNTSGDIVKLKNLTYSWPSSHTATSFLKNDGSGTLTWSTDITATSLKWNALIAPDNDLSLAHAAFTTTMGWTSTGALNAWTMNFNNNSTSATTQNAFIINNALVGSFTDTTTENLLLLQQLDTTAAGTTVVDNALKIDSAGNSNIIDAIEIANSVGNITNAINIADTTGTITTGILMSGTFTNLIDTPTFDVNNAGTVTIATGQSYTGSGTVTLSSAAASALTINSGTTGSIGIGDDASAETITLGTGAAAKAVTVGSTNTTSSLTLDSGTGAINIGTSIAKTITIGNTTGATALALNSGTGDITLASTDQVKLNSSKAAGGTTTEAFSIKSTVDLGATDEVLQVGDSAADFLTIRGDGNVGIGTTAPDSKLHIVSGDVYIAPDSGYTFNNPSGNEDLYVYGNLEVDGTIYGAGGSLVSGTGTAGQATFWTGSSSIGGDNAFWWDNSSKRLGIGTTAPSTKLDVVGTGRFYDSTPTTGVTTLTLRAGAGQATSPLFQWQNNAGTGLGVIDASGNVGIGTTGPATVFDIGGGTNYINTNATYQIVPTTAKTIQVRDTANSALNLVSDANTNGAVLGAVMFSRSGGQADAHLNVAGLRAVEVGTGVLAGGALQFYTKPSGGGFTAPRMVIDSTGNVGIGTTGPNTKLDVRGDLVVYGTTTGYTESMNSFFTGTAATGGGLNLHAGAAGTVPSSSTLKGYYRIRGTAGTDYNTILGIYGGAIGEQIPIEISNANGDVYLAQSTGNVGIGDVSPLSLLTVGSGDKFQVGTNGNLTINTGTSATVITAERSANGYVIETNVGGTPGVDIGTEAGVGHAVIAFKNTDILVGKSGTSGIAFGSGVGWADVPAGATDINIKGNVGIGTAGPLGKLHVYTDSTSADGVVLLQHSTNDTSTAALDLQFKNSGTQYAGIRVSNPSSNVTNMEFSNWSGSARTVRMGIYGTNGNVGIGTTGPGDKLEVAAGHIRVSGGVGYGFRFDTAAGMYQQTGTGINSAITFQTNALDRVTIQDTGNVGIGTTNPSTFKLEVAGNIGPEATGTRDLGSTARVWNNIYANNYYQGSTLVGLWLDAGTYIYPVNVGTTFQVTDTGNLTVPGTASFNSGGVTIDASSFVNAQRFVDIGTAYYLDPAADPSLLVAGKVGIGTTNPQAKLDIAGTNSVISNSAGDITINAASNYISFAGDSLTNINNLYVSGNVGIGTTDPGAKLHVYGTTYGTFRVGTAAQQGLDFSNASGDLYLGGDNTQAGNFYIKDSTGALKVAINSDASSYFMGGNVGIGTTGPNAKLNILDTVGDILQLSGPHGSNIGLYVGSTATGVSVVGINNARNTFNNIDLRAQAGTQLYLKTDGNVGIGTTGPGFKLDVTGTGRFTSDLRADTKIGFNSDPANYYIGGIGNGMEYRPWSVGNFTFNAGAGNWSFTNGNVGIGTTSPDEKLHVYGGNIRIRDSDGDTIDIGEEGGGSGRFDFGYQGGASATQNLLFYGGDAGNSWKMDNFTVQADTSTFTGNIECTACIDQGDLKTATGEVSITASCSTGGGTSCSNTNSGNSTLPGGEYGFYPQSKNTRTYSGYCGSISYDAQQEIYDDTAQVTSYTTYIWQYAYVYCSSGNPGTSLSTTMYAQQRYIQASPPYFIDDYHIKHFVYILRNKNTNETIAGYQAEDPPWENNGGDKEKVPHPFTEYFTKPLPENLEIAFIDSSEVETWKAKAKEKGLSLLEYLNNYMEVDPTDVSLPISPETGKPIRLQRDVTWRNIRQRATPVVHGPTETITPTTERADLAELFGTSDVLMGAGDIVDIHPKSETDKNNVLEKTKTAYSPRMAGIISANPAQILNQDSFEGDGIPLALVGKVSTNVSTINGPIKPGDPITSSEIPGVGMKATKAGPIVGKALEPYDNPDSNAVGKIMVFVNLSWYDPSAFITNAGDLGGIIPISTNTTNKYQLVDKVGEVLDRFIYAGEAIIAELKAGLINTQELFAEKKIVSPLIETQEIKTDRISLKEIEAKPGEDITIDLRRKTLDSSEENLESKFGRLIVKGKEGKEVASIDSEGNATFSGTVEAEEVRAKKIIAEEIVGLKGKFGELLASTSSATYITQNITNITQIIEATPSPTPSPIPSPTPTPLPEPGLPATESGEIDALADIELSPDIEALVDEILNTSLEATPQTELANTYGDSLKIANGLTVLGTTSLADTSIAGSLNIGGTMNLSDNSINSLTGPLYLQNLGLGGIDILAGKIVIDQQGNATFEGNVTIKGRLALSEIEPLPEEDLTINLASSSGFGKLLVKGVNNEIVASIDASGSAFFAKLGIEADYSATQSGAIIAASDNWKENRSFAPAIKTNATAGIGILPAGETEIQIYNPNVTDQSLIYVVPSSDTENKVLFVKAKKAHSTDSTSSPQASSGQAGWFKVAIDTSITKDIQFNWWIIGGQTQ